MEGNNFLIAFRVLFGYTKNMEGAGQDDCITSMPCIVEAAF